MRERAVNGLGWSAAALALGLASAACNGSDDSPAAPRDAGATDAGTKINAETRDASQHAASDAGAGGAGGSHASAADGGGKAPSKDAGMPTADARAVAIQFRAMIGDQEFACGKSYAGQGSSHVTVTPQDLRMYVAEVDLITKSGESQRVVMDDRNPWQTSDIALLDFEDGTGGCFGDAAVNRQITGHVPAGDYDAVSFIVGVTDTLNHGKPETLPQPLQEPGMSWNWLLGFRFIKAELGAINQGDDADGGVGRGVFHLGSVACSGNPNMGTVTCGKPNRNDVKLTKFDPDADAIVFDVGALFSTLDLRVDSECHSAEPVCDPMFRAIGIDLGTGQPATTQTVFSVKPQK